MLTPKQEAYCLARARGLSQRQAYLSAYPASRTWKPETVDKRASELESSNGEVLGRLETVRAEAAEAARIDRSEVIDALADLYRDASERAAGASIEDYPKAANVAAKAADTLLRHLPDDAPGDDREFTADFGLLLAPPFLEPHRVIHARSEADLWLGGGRGSTKSSFAGLEVVYHIERNPGQHAVVLQRHKANLRDGAYAQVVWAIAALGLSDAYDMPDSTLRIRKRSTGQLILFRGCDNPRKIKGVKVPFGHVGIVWYEEADMFRGMAEVRMVNQSLTRGGADAVRLYTYNPPRSKTCWINEHVGSHAAWSHSSTYLDVPPEWLGTQFIADAEELRRADPKSYEHEYLGVPVGLGGDVFDNVTFREVTDEETASFDNLRCGQDFGWYPDPWALTVSEWQPGARRLITWHEDWGNKLQPWEQAERIKVALTWPDYAGQEPSYHALRVLSDDAEPATIAAQRDAGVNARAAGKGGMRDASYRLLQSVEWVIDPARCPRLAEEVRAKQYEQTPGGEWLSEIPDGDDHLIDATRYAMMAEARARRAWRRPATGAGE